MAGGTADPFNVRPAGNHVRRNLLGILGEYDDGRHMAREAAALFIRRRIRLPPKTQHGPKNPRLHRRAMPESGIHPAERLQIPRLVYGALPLFVMTLMTLLAGFGTD